jgi:hypothetical protein
MLLDSFLSPADDKRAQRTLQKLNRHGFAALVLTGGFAIELHRIRRGFSPMLRPLHDIDFLADTFGAIQTSLRSEFLFLHVHPNDPPAKTLLQSVDPEMTVRVDVFRAYGDEMKRAISVDAFGETVRVIGLEDLVARTARLSMDLASNTTMPAKHARDFLRLLPLVETEAVERVWQEHRKPGHATSFIETANRLTHLIHSRPDLQIVLEYSHDAEQICPRCEPTADFQLADPGRILSLLGYC